jgi:hypothetical protein
VVSRPLRPFTIRFTATETSPRDAHRPHPEEAALLARLSRRMEARFGLAAILRDARKSALLRMRPSRCIAATAVENAVEKPVHKSVRLLVDFILADCA